MLLPVTARHVILNQRLLAQCRIHGTKHMPLKSRDWSFQNVEHPGPEAEAVTRPWSQQASITNLYNT